MGSYLGQNFLVDPKIKNIIAEKIINLYNDLNCDTLIEIGPGKGAITKKICNASKNFFVIEKDERMVGLLQEKIKIHERLKTGLKSENIINSDILDLDVKEFLKEKKLNFKKTLVVGNLPYYITSPILRKFFGYGEQEFSGGVFLIQHEVAEKIKTDAHKKSYLRWLLNHSYHVKYAKGVPAKAFKPAPKVKSAVIQLTKNSEEGKIPFHKLQEFLNIFAAFSRKTLGRIKKMQEKKLDKLVFDIPEDLKKKRLEELELKELEIIIL